MWIQSPREAVGKAISKLLGVKSSPSTLKKSTQIMGCSCEKPVHNISQLALLWLLIISQLCKWG